MSWTYDLETESLRNERGHHIGQVEPASGPLAASAPELLEALEWAEETIRLIFGDDDTVAVHARAAIAKARGT